MRHKEKLDSIGIQDLNLLIIEKDCSQLLYLEVLCFKSLFQDTKKSLI